MGADHAPNLVRNPLDGTSAVDYAKTGRFGCGQRAVGVADTVVEGRFLLFHSIRAIPVAVASFRPREAGDRIDLDEQRQIGLEAPAGDAVESQYRFRAQSASTSLVSE